MYGKPFLITVSAWLAFVVLSGMFWSAFGYVPRTSTEWWLGVGFAAAGCCFGWTVGYAVGRLAKADGT